MPFAILVGIIHIYSVHYLCNIMMKKDNAFRNISWNNTYIFRSLHDQSCFFHLHFSVTVDHILHQQRRRLSDWSVQSVISLVNPLKPCQFIRSAGRRLPPLWLFFLFQVSGLFMRSDTLVTTYFFWRKVFSTERKSWAVIDNVQNLVSKKTTVFGATKSGRRTAKCPFLALSSL